MMKNSNTTAIKMISICYIIRNDRSDNEFADESKLIQQTNKFIFEINEFWYSFDPIYSICNIVDLMTDLHALSKDSRIKNLTSKLNGIEITIVCDQFGNVICYCSTIKLNPRIISICTFKIQWFWTNYQLFRSSTIHHALRCDYTLSMLGNSQNSWHKIVLYHHVFLKT